MIITKTAIIKNKKMNKNILSFDPFLKLENLWNQTIKSRIFEKTYHPYNLSSKAT